MKTTQTQRVVGALMARWLTYDGMNKAARTRTHCAHKRALDWLKTSRGFGWKLDKRTNAEGWTEWHIVRAR